MIWRALPHGSLPGILIPRNDPCWSTTADHPLARRRELCQRKQHGRFSSAESRSANQRRLCSTSVGRIRTCTYGLTSLVASPRASCHEQRNLLLHEDHPSMHTLTRHCPSIPPRLAKKLGRSVALHGTDVGPYFSRHPLGFAIFRWYQRILDYMCKLWAGHTLYYRDSQYRSQQSSESCTCGWSLTTRSQITILPGTPHGDSVQRSHRAVVPWGRHRSRSPHEVVAARLWGVENKIVARHPACFRLRSSPEEDIPPGSRYNLTFRATRGLKSWYCAN